LSLTFISSGITIMNHIFIKPRLELQQVQNVGY
jgi:hypothetical protein